MKTKLLSFRSPFSCINVERGLHRSIVDPGQWHDFRLQRKTPKNGIAPLPFPLPALLKQYCYIKRGERVRVRGHAQFYATLGLKQLSESERTAYTSAAAHAPRSFPSFGANAQKF